MNELARVNNENPVFTTMNCETVQEKKTFFNAVQNPVGKVSDLINKEIRLKDIYMEFIEGAFVDEETGEVIDSVKTILIDENGQGWFTRSKGICQSIRDLLQVFGMPSEWGEPITVMIRQIDTSKGRTFRIEVV